MYSFSSKVRFSECDSTSTLTIPALINYFQDCSTFHCESIDRGIAYTTAHDFAWFVAAWEIQILRLPRFTEDIRISTWSWADRAALANRAFRMETASGEELARADSLWFPFSISRKRPVRIPKDELSYLNECNHLDMPPMQRKIKLTGEGMQQTAITVSVHHLDTNNHVNNVQYIAMANDVVRAHDGMFTPALIHVQYKRAAQLGDVIIPRLYVEDTGYAVDLASEQGDSFAIVRMERQ